MIEQKYVKAPDKSQAMLAEWIYQSVTYTLQIIAAERGAGEPPPKGMAQQECHRLIDEIEDPPGSGKLPVRRMLEKTAAWVTRRLEESR